ncbi:unnamed protein product [Cuscuta campestris]|uniref:Amino acid transporter transmembrane domain-containing protein n=1 Tax=Cuscuta campestris TaxID=132261 RepID=A0A484MQT6_9ASTE|nr:unnamed protein product [Cuscuta campestris]
MHQVCAQCAVQPWPWQLMKKKKTKLLIGGAVSLLALTRRRISDAMVEKTGNEWTALAHIITAVIGSGVLSLAWSMSKLGWIAGPITMLCFAVVTLTSALLLSNCHRSTDSDLHTHGSYLDAVCSVLGNRSAWFCGIIVGINFIKLGIVYTITSAISVRSVNN